MAVGRLPHIMPVAHVDDNQEVVTTQVAKDVTRPGR